MAKAANTGGERRTSWQSAVAGFILGGFAGGFLGYFGDALAGWAVDEYWSPSPSVKIDFQAEQRCPNGKLTDIRRFFEDDGIPLSNGADQLTICDSEALMTTRSQVPRDLAAKYPACLKWIDSDLIMLRASTAICALPDKAGFVCDGVNGRIFPGSGALGIGNSVELCATELLVRFGFSS
ncbi:hypothetical protein NKH24_20210 [Mesorhizobium sp. M1300]|uniref:hypothetical protein n=1 Tax=Mesorhizobium sp. M1300 TaxID=2957077 RepID=UPI00333B441C